MHVIRKRGWEIPERLATPESVYLNRREILKASGFSLMSGLAATALANPVAAQTQAGSNADLYPAPRDSKCTTVSQEAIDNRERDCALCGDAGDYAINLNGIYLDVSYDFN